jgi:lysophospholipid acyltransferase (LPLAT)-like uncharacterized protein
MDCDGRRKQRHTFQLSTERIYFRRSGRKPVARAPKEMNQPLRPIFEAIEKNQFVISPDGSECRVIRMKDGKVKVARVKDGKLQQSGWMPVAVLRLKS